MCEVSISEQIMGCVFERGVVIGMKWMILLYWIAKEGWWVSKTSLHVAGESDSTGMIDLSKEIKRVEQAQFTIKYSRIYKKDRLYIESLSSRTPVNQPTRRTRENATRTPPSKDQELKGADYNYKRCPFHHSPPSHIKINATHTMRPIIIPQVTSSRISLSSSSRKRKKKRSHRPNFSFSLVIPLISKWIAPRLPLLSIIRKAKKYINYSYTHQMKCRIAISSRTQRRGIVE